MRAQKDTQDAFMRYTSCLDIERQARQAVASAEKRRDDISMPISKTHLTTILTMLPASGCSTLPEPSSSGCANFLFCLWHTTDSLSRHAVKEVVNIRGRSSQSPKISNGGES
jgi:hypothetical protein